MKHLDAAHLVVGAETNLSRKPPASNMPLLKKLIPDPGKQTLESHAVPSLRNIIMVDNSAGRVDVGSVRCVTPYERVVEDGGSGRALNARHLSPDEIVNIQFTSGTTSMPKAASLTHRSILNNGNSIGVSACHTADREPDD